MGNIKAIVKHCFSERFITTLLKKYSSLKISCRYKTIYLMSKSQLGASIYYMFFSKAFRRESYTVMQGILKYQDNLSNDAKNIYQLRRNIHRLEKGLIMKPRRPVFAKDYIIDTVSMFSKLSQNLDVSVAEDIAWANDVLNEYFSVTASDIIIDQARIEFNNIGIMTKVTESKKIPYSRDLAEKGVNYDDFLRLCIKRRSVRWYLPKKVPRDLVDNAIVAASQAPSACNRQPFKFTIIDEPDLLKTVSKIPGGTAGFHQNFQMIIVVTGDLSAYFHERDRHVIYIDSSLATMNFLLALETQGLSSCVINWPDVEVNERKMISTLNIPKSEKIIMAISVGWPEPEGLIPYSQKKNIEHLREYK